MTAAAEFEEAQATVKKLNSTPKPAVLLKLYGLFKQAKKGDVEGKRPGMLDIRGRAKFDAWSQEKGMSEENAEKQYVLLVERLAAEEDAPTAI